MKMSFGILEEEFEDTKEEIRIRNQRRTENTMAKIKRTTKR
jgi:hypothetical protein